VVVSAVEAAVRVSNPDWSVLLAAGREVAIPQRGRPAREPAEIPAGRLDWRKSAAGAAGAAERPGGP
jgi:hypothetical protein